MPILASDWAALNPSNFSVPGTLVSAATIAPISFFTVLTGNTAVATITPPVPHAHMLCLEFAGVAGVVATGNIKTAQASVVGIGMLLIYNPATGKYTPVL